MYSYFEIPFNTMRVLDMSWVVIGGRCVWGGGGGGQDMISIVSPTTPLATTPACGARKKKSGKITRNRKVFVELSYAFLSFSLGPTRCYIFEILITHSFQI